MKVTYFHVGLVAFLANTYVAHARAVCGPSFSELCKSPTSCLGGDKVCGLGQNSIEKRGLPKPKDPFKDPDSPGTSSPGSNPFRDPSSSPDSTGSNPFRDPDKSDPPAPGSPSGGGVSGAGSSQVTFKDASYEAQREKGENVLNDFNSDLGANQGKTQSMKEAGYTGQGLERSLPFDPDDKSGEYLGPFGLKVDEKWNHDKIQLSGKNADFDPAILEMYASKDQKAIIVKKSYGKDEDLNGVLRWSDMTMSNWRNEAGDIGVKDLKFIVRDNIQTVDTIASDGTKLNTVNAINQAFTRMNAPNTETLVLTLDRSSRNADELAAFQLMAVQTHVARVYRMLKDFRTDLGNLDIAKLHLQTNKQNPTKVAQYNIIIELGPRTT